MRFHFKFVICSQFVLEWWKYCHRHKKYCFELLSFYPSKLMNSCVYNGRNILLSLNATNMIIPSSSLLRYIILNQRDTFCYWARDGIFRFLFFLFQFLQMVEEVLISFTIHHTNVITNIVNQSLMCIQTIKTCASVKITC